MPWPCAACGGENPDGTRFCGHCGTRREEHASPDVSAAVQELSREVAYRSNDARIGDEHRIVTALFADISGFTSLADEMDADELHEIISPVISRLAAVGERFGGFIAKFAGDALLVFFGAPVAHEDDAVRALLVAQEMHRELERTLTALPEAARHLQLHIGVNSGRVVSGMFGGETTADYSILGDAVNLAQRLESVAPAGETYVGDTTARQVQDRFDLEPLGEVQLKGKGRPVIAWRLLGQRRTEAPSAGGGPAPLVGRDEELAGLVAVLDSVRAGQGGVIGVTGEPGVGKSRLAAEVRRRASSAGIRWLEARCISYGASLPYWPYADMLRGAIGIHIEDDRARAAEALRSSVREMGIDDALPYLANLLGVSTDDALAALEPEAFRRGLHTAMASWLAALASREPVVLAIEDLHWADASTLELTVDLARRTAELPVAFYLSGRPEAQESIETVAASAAASRTISLRPLDAAAVDALVRWTLEGEAPTGFVRTVMERTGGNPFFVEEVVRALVQAGTLSRVEGRWRLPVGWTVETVPDTLEGVLAARIDRLERPVADILQMASVIGRRVRISLLEAIGPEGPAVGTALDSLVAEGFLDPVESDGEPILLFHHALLQDVAYGRLLRRRRRELHRRVAEEAETLYGSGDEIVDLLARHYYLGEAGPRALQFLLRAGRRARGLFANDEAIVHFQRAVEVCRTLDGCEERVPDMLLDLGDLNDLRGRYDEALEAYREVRDATNDVRAWRGMAAILRKRGEYDGALSIVDTAFGACQVPDAARAPLWLERGWTLGLAGQTADGITAMKQGLAALPSREEGVAGDLLLQLARSEVVEGRHADALEHAQEARDIFERLEDPRGLAKALRIVGDVFTSLDRLPEAAAALRRGLELAERVGSVDEIGGSLINLGLVELKRGNLEEAIAADRRAVEEFERVSHEFGRSTAYANLAEKLMLRGDLDEALAYCQKALELARKIGYTMTVADATMTLASLRLRQGDLEDAVDRAEESARLFMEMSAPVYAGEALELAAEAVERSGDRERAAAILQRARSLTPA